MPNLEHTTYKFQISIKERTDSEIYFLSQIARNSEKSEEELEREFPRWKELCASEYPDVPLCSDVSNKLSDHGVKKNLIPTFVILCK